MGDLTNYDIYKIDGLAIEGYIFSVQEDTDEEPTFHYYMITIAPNKKPSITKLTFDDGKLIDIESINI